MRGLELTATADAVPTGQKMRHKPKLRRYHRRTHINWRWLRKGLWQKK